MPSLLQNTSRQRIFLSLCMIGLLCTVKAHADEFAPANRSAVYHASPNQPLQNTATRLSSYPENTPRFREGTRQAAPLNALINDSPAYKTPPQEPAHLPEVGNHLDRGRPFTNHTASPIGTTGGGQVQRVDHLAPPSEQTKLPGSRFSPQASPYTPTPLPESSSASPIPLPAKGESKGNGPSSDGVLAMMATMGGALLLVVGLFLVFAWLLKRTSTRTGGMLPKEVIEVLGHQTITGRHQVHLLRIGKRLLLVSVMPDSVETLTEITDPTEVDQIAGICHQAGPGSSTGAFQAIMRQFSQDTKSTQDPIPTVDQLRQRLGS